MTRVYDKRTTKSSYCWLKLPRMFQFLLFYCIYECFCKIKNNKVLHYLQKTVSTTILQTRMIAMIILHKVLLQLLKFCRVYGYCHVAFIKLYCGIALIMKSIWLLHITQSLLCGDSKLWFNFSPQSIGAKLENSPDCAIITVHSFIYCFATRTKVSLCH